MFIASRDLKFAKGRFFLMGFIVTLVAFLVILLSGMSEGLIKANISGLMELPATHIAFEDNGNPSYRQTMVERYMWEGWANEDGVLALEPLGHTVFIARDVNDKPHEIALWGIEPGSFVEPPVIIGEGWGEVENGVVITGDLGQGRCRDRRRVTSRPITDYAQGRRHDRRSTQHRSSADHLRSTAEMAGSNVRAARRSATRREAAGYSVRLRQCRRDATRRRRRYRGTRR